MDRQQAHQLLDQLGPAQFEAIVRLLEVMIHDDGEELTVEDRRAVAASRDYFRQNPEAGLPFEQVVAECGFTMDQVRHHRAICKKANGVTPSKARLSLKRAKIGIVFPVPNVREQPARASATQPAVPKVKRTAASKNTGGKSPQILAAMAQATLPNLMSAGLINVPLELERSYKGEVDGGDPA